MSDVLENAAEGDMHANSAVGRRGVIAAIAAASAAVVVGRPATAHAATGADDIAAHKAQLPLNVRDYGAGKGQDDAQIVNQLIQSLPPEGGVIFFPGGLYRISSPIEIVNRDGVKLVGDSMGGVTVFTQVPLPEMVRVIDSSGVSIRGLTLSSSVNGFVDVGVLVGATAGNSIHGFDMRDVVITRAGGTGTVGYVKTGIAVGGRLPGSVSGVAFWGCRVTGMHEIGYLIGNGVPGKVRNAHFYGCDARLNVRYGVVMRGASLVWDGGTTQFNGTATTLAAGGSDFKLEAPGDGPILIKSVRSETSSRFWECTTMGVEARSVTLSDILLTGYYNMTGEVLVHRASHPLTMIDCNMSNYSGLTTGASVPPRFTLAADPAHPLVFTAVNLQSTADDPIGSPENVITHVIGFRKQNIYGATEPPATGALSKIGDIVHAPAGVTTRAVDGAVTDGGINDRPAPDGTLAVDTANSRFYAKSGGTWKSVALNDEPATLSGSVRRSGRDSKEKNG